MRGLRAALAGAAAVIGLAGTLKAQAADACGGRDLKARFAAEEPETARAIEGQVARMPFAQGKLFRISKPGVAPSFLFGTVHVADGRVTTFPPALTQALDGASAVALELAEVDGLNDPATLDKLGTKLLSYIVARPAERSERFLSAPDMARLEDAVARRGQPRAVARTLKPSILATILALPACAVTQDSGFVDALVARRAKAKGVPVVGLETLDEQLALLGQLPAEAQGGLLTAAIRVLDIHEDLYETTIRRYMAGETGWLIAYMAYGRPAPGISAPTPEAFTRNLIDGRNLRMRDRSLALLEAGGAVVAVGAAHLPGENGLARLYEQAGYRVERLD